MLTAAKVHRAMPLVIAVVAVVWFLVLSEWLLVKPGGLLVNRLNVLFHSDASLEIALLAHEDPPAQPAFQYFVHPLKFYFWRPICRGLYFCLSAILSQEEATVLSVKLLAATVAGFGVGCLALLAAKCGLTIAQCILVFVMYLLFTANVLVAVPEHYSLSNGLLSAIFTASIAGGNALSTTLVVAITGGLVGGTTVTNALLPAAILVRSYFRSKVIVVGIVSAFVVVLGVVTLALATLSDSIGWFVHTFSNWRLFNDPLGAVQYAVLGLVYPAIGPSPYLDREAVMIGYSPFSVAQYSWVQVPGLIAWVALLLICGKKGLANPKTKPHVLLLVSWIAFNLVLHNVWGDEFFLCTPHWSWALGAIVILGVRDVPLVLTASMVLPLVIGQTKALMEITEALSTLSGL